MAHLTLAGVSADGRRLLLVSDKGAEFTLDINPALRAALRGETTRLGQLEIKMSSSLRPREIQDRIRSGETPEAVATAAQTTVEAIMPYVAPVLAEREHIATRAQKSSVRRAQGDSGAPQTRGSLGDAVAAHLRTQDTKPETVEWDSHRRDDGRWVLTADFDAPRRTGTARFVFDAPGSYVLPDNDDARWLVGDLIAATPAAARDDLQQVRQRRLSAVDSEELPLGDDAIDLVTDEPAPAASYDEPLRPTVPAEPEDEPADETPAAEAPAAEDAPHRRPVQKKRGRASVPSWDEIMFGGGDQ